nr:immunoglobulin heavy chain junction region [Mus musculus]
CTNIYYDYDGSYFDYW